MGGSTDQVHGNGRSPAAANSGDTKEIKNLALDTVINLDQYVNLNLFNLLFSFNSYEFLYNESSEI